MTPVPTILVCLRVEDGPARVASDRLVCSRCLADVWRSESGRWWVGTVICLRCALASDEADFVAAPWVRDDLVTNHDIATAGARMARRQRLD